jgi:hypothetical protein
MLMAIILTVLLVITTAMFHFTVLKWLSGGMARIKITAQFRFLIIVLVVLMAHMAEIVLYAVAYGISVEFLRLGTFGGLPVQHPLDYLYFSIVSYTSLGLGDVFPGDHLRFVTGVEALNGLLLIAWSGSFIYIAMGRLWPWQISYEPEHIPPPPEGTRS